MNDIALKFDAQGLLPAVVQDHLTGQVRMVAWMNQQALGVTLSSGKATFFSRSRNCLWTKGETSGHTLLVRDVFLDCDADTLLVQVDPRGPTCHTGRPACFFRRVGPDGLLETGALEAAALLERVEATLHSRKTADASQSYTKTLLEAGPEKIGAKIREEAHELCHALSNESEDRVASEAADVMYHLLVGLLHRGVSWRSVLDKLDQRLGTSGHEEKAARSAR